MNARVESNSTPAPSTGAFLFTDIEGSTVLWENDPSLMAEQLAAHDRLLTEAIESHEGSQFKHMGDGIAAAYPTSYHAIASAVKMQTLFAEHPWPSTCRIGIRIGVHQGPFVQTENDYFGRTLNWTARIMSAGHAGQIVVSTIALQSLTANERQQYNLRNEGVHRLKGIAEDVELWSVAPPTMPFVDRPLRTLDPTERNTIPLMLSNMIGRDDELSTALDRVSANRLVSLIGPGGAGKTRLAVAVATESVQRFRGGVHVVELAPTDAGGVRAAIVLTVLGPDALAATGTELDRVAAMGMSRDRPLLLVLDNCEHVVEAVSDAVSYLLGKAPGITVLTTSREPLGIRGEATLAVEPLSLASSEGSPESSPAVQLFLQRARSAAPKIHDLDLATVSKICQRLDGLPLAIELAAARVGVLSLPDLDARLYDVLRSARRSNRQSGTADRHATIDAAVRWSYDLLTDDERLVLGRASVFVGSFNLEAASAVCSGTELTEFDVMEILSLLVDRSMVSSVYAEIGNRFRILEVIREFVTAQLPDPDVVALQGTHQQHYLRTTASLAFALDAKPDASIIAMLEADDPNVFAAMRHTGTPATLSNARKLALQLHTFFEETGRVPRAYEEFRRLLEPREPQSRLWRSVLGTSVIYGVMTGRWDETPNDLDTLRELVSGEPDITALNAYLGLAFVALTTANMTEACEWFATAGSVVGQFDTNGQRQWEMTAGACAAYDDRPVDALNFYQTARKLPGVPQGWFLDYSEVFVRAARIQHDPARGDAHVAPMLESLTSLVDLQLGFRTTVATLKAAVALEQVDDGDGLDRWWRVALDAAYANGHLWGVGMALELSAWSAARRQDDVAAATRFAVAESAFARAGFRFPALLSGISANYTTAVRQRLGTDYPEVSAAAKLLNTATFAAQASSS